MPFEAVTNLASVQAAEDERKRRQQQASLQQDALDLKRQEAERTADNTSGPAALLAQLQKGGGKIAVDPDVIDQANQDQFLNDQAQRRFTRREADLGKKSETLAVPGPSATERATTLLAPLGPLATEDPEARNRELATDPRGRLARLSALKDYILTDPVGVSRETSPIYTDAPRRGGATQDVTYGGALAGLQGADVLRSAIRKEFGGTAPDTTLSFSDRPEPGMRQYGAPGRREDVGAPGGGFATIGGKSPDTTAQGALLAGLNEQMGEAKRQSSTPQEIAKGLVEQEPLWDAKAAELGPYGVRDALNQWVAGGGDPKVGSQLQHRYAGVADDVDPKNGDPIDPRDFADRLKQMRAPAPGEAEARAKTGGQIVPAVETQKQQAVQSALQAPQDGPGTTPSPASNTGEGFFSGLAGAARRGTDRLSGGTPMPATPEGFPSPGDIMRVAGPLAAAGPTAGLSIPAAAGAGFGVGAGSELLGQLLNGETINPKVIGATGLMDAAGGAAVPALSRLVGRGFGAVKALGKRFAPDAIPGIYGPEWSIGAPTRVMGGLTEEAGVKGGTKSALDLARMGSADVGSAPIPTGPVPYDPQRLPALRGGGFEMGRASTEAAAGRPIPAQRLLEGPRPGPSIDDEWDYIRRAIPDSTDDEWDYIRRALPDEGEVTPASLLRQLGMMRGR